MGCTGPNIGSPEKYRSKGASDNDHCRHERLEELRRAGNRHAKTANGAMGKDDFLKLLFTQLKYQDPQNPVDDREFAAQLAQFSSLEQMTNLNTSFGEIKAALEQQGKFSLLQAVGRNGPGRRRRSRRGCDGEAERHLLARRRRHLRENHRHRRQRNSAAGAEPRRGKNRGNGLSWDGTLEGGYKAPAGRYRFMVEAADGAGQAVSSATSMEGIVTGVTLNGDPAATIGDFQVPFTKISMLKG